MIKFLALLLTFNVCAEVEVYRLGNLQVAFSEVDGFLVNRSCAKFGCTALRKAKKSKEKFPRESSLAGGKNPAAVKCKEILEGTVVIGTDRKGNEQSFCSFRDGSYIRN